MVWGAIAYDSRSTLIGMRETLTGRRDIDDILPPHVGLFLNGLPGAIFQQDNARPIQSLKMTIVISGSLRSLDIIGHWNAKRSSVPYLTYWALLRWCFLIGGHGRRQWAGRTGDFGDLRKNQVQIRASRREARLLLVVRDR
ncbi:hypothetical protein TNCV_1624071 [Trichonephila clavipes]|nr:hypothetical protein TNCV_1624071 [Trichonephila clavipes]